MMKIKHRYKVAIVFLFMVLVSVKSLQYYNIRKQLHLLCDYDDFCTDFVPKELVISDIERKVVDSFCYKEKNELYFPWDEYNEIMRHERNLVSLVFLLQNENFKILGSFALTENEISEKGRDQTEEILKEISNWNIIWRKKDFYKPSDVSFFKSNRENEKIINFIDRKIEFLCTAMTDQIKKEAYIFTCGKSYFLMFLMPHRESLDSDKTLKGAILYRNRETKMPNVLYFIPRKKMSSDEIFDHMLSAFSYELLQWESRKGCDQEKESPIRGSVKRWCIRK